MSSFVKFLKDNLSAIGHCIVTQIALLVFGLVLSMATHQNNALLLATGLFSVAFYLYLLYDAIWREGSSDKIRIDGGRMEYQPLKGLWISLIANAVNILLAILIWIGYFLPIAPGDTASELSGTCQVIALFIEGMYSGVIGFLNNGTANSSALTASLYTLIVLPAPIACTIAYIRGAHDKTLFARKK